MANVRVKGIIIKITNFKDYDRYLSILTENAGIISVFARGIRRRQNKLNSSCQLFSFNEFELFYNKERYTLNDANTIRVFSNLNSDIYLLTAAAQIAELVMDNSQYLEDSPRLYELVIRTFYELDIQKRNPRLVTYTAEMKLCTFFGYEPWLNYCFVCHAALNENAAVSYFDFRNARLFCAQHGLAEKEKMQTNVHRISPALLKTLRYIIAAELKDLFAFQLSEDVTQELAAFTNLYLMERFDKDYDKITVLDNFI